MKKGIKLILLWTMLTFLLAGCGLSKQESLNNSVDNDNVKSEVSDKVQDNLENNTDSNVGDKKIELYNGKISIKDADMGNATSEIDAGGYMCALTNTGDFYYSDEEKNELIFSDKSKILEVQSEYNDTEIDEVLEKKIEERIEKECITKIAGGHYTNLNYVNNKLYCIDKNDKLKVINLDNNEISDFTSLSQFDIKMMYLSKEDFILFKDDTNRVYIYKFDEDKVYYATELENVYKFYPTEKGIIYIILEQDLYDIYADNTLRVDSAKLTSNYFYVKEVEGTKSFVVRYNNEDCAVPLDKLFDVAQKIEIE